MAQKSKRIEIYDKEKAKLVNSETLELSKKYDIDMSLRELRENTINAYKSDLFQWFIYILDFQNNKSVKEVTEDDLTEFFYYCKQQGNNSRRMRRRMSSVSAFFIFLKKKKLITINPMEYIDRPAKDTDIMTQTYLSSEQVDLMRIKLNESIDSATTSFRKHYFIMLRCYAFFSLSTMARVNAVSSIMWKQIDFDNRIVREVVEKEGYVVELFFSNEVGVYLIDLLNCRTEHGIDDNGYIFIGNYKNNYNRVSNGTMSEWCKVIGEMINVPTLHCHDFRHSAATLLKNKGMSLEDVSKLLNHKGTEVTLKHYLKLDTQKLQENKDKYEI